MPVKTRKIPRALTRTYVVPEITKEGFVRYKVRFVDARRGKEARCAREAVKEALRCAREKAIPR
jgi:hypothetical protein